MTLPCLENAGQARNQALRTALALCALSGRAMCFRGLVDDGARPQPGLGPGHLTAAAAAAKVTGGLIRAAIGEPEMEFTPGRPQAGEYEFDVSRHQRSNAPLSWVMETTALALAASGGESGLLLDGGTHVPGGPFSDYLAKVLTPNLRMMGMDLTFLEITPGFAPAGGGEAEVSVRPANQLTPFVADEPFRAMAVGVEVTLCGLPVHLGEQALEGAKERLQMHGLDPALKLRRVSGPAKGMALLAWARGSKAVMGFSALGRRGGRPEALAIETVEELVSFFKTEAGLSQELAILLLPYMAAANGMSRITLDRIGPGLKAAARAVEAVWPSTVRLLEGSGGGLVHMLVQGRDLGRSA